MTRRLRRSRAKGARLPDGAVIVDRSTMWGNPFVVGKDGTAAECVRLFKLMLLGQFALLHTPSVWDQQAAQRDILGRIDELRGRDLACWCALDKPCHADVLITLANRPLQCEMA